MIRGDEKERVLLVERNSINQRLEGGMLARLGFDVDVVVDCAGAAKAARQTCYRAIMIDYLIPVRDGCDATTEFYRLKGGSRATPVIGIIARGTDADDQRSLAAGLDACVTRPFNLEALATILAPWSPQGRETIDASREWARLVG